MTLRPDLPILIVGQGIAGTILAFEASKRGIPFEILDDGHRSASSIAAAGLYNPFILKRAKLSWKALDFFPSSRQFFAEAEQELGTGIDHEIGIVRRIHDIKEHNNWTAVEDELLATGLLGGTCSSDSISTLISAPLGYRAVPQAGYVDTGAFLSRSKQLFRDKGFFTEGVFKEEAVELGSTLKYENKAYSSIIVCKGYRSGEPDRFFSDLPFNPAKGHTLTIHCPDLTLDTIVSGPCFILPLGKGNFRIGSTYSWSKFNEEVEEQEVEKLRVNFRSFCQLPFEVLDCKAGVRPATKDRRPLIGASSVDVRVQLFGGMGSRAIMCAPLLAQMHLDKLFSTGEIWPEVCLSRFSS